MDPIPEDIDLSDDNEADCVGDEDVNWDQVVELEAVMNSVTDETVLDFYDHLAGHDG